MRLRTQLAIAFLLLAVVPLAGIVLYSYYTSLRAVRQATEAEARTLSSEMDGRMASIRSELGQGVQRMGGVPVQDLLNAAEAKRQGKSDPLLGQMVRGFGDAASLVRSLEFIPVHPGHQPPAAGKTLTVPVPPTKVVIDVSQILKEVHKELEGVPGIDPQTLAEVRQAGKEALAAEAEKHRQAVEVEKEIAKEQQRQAAREQARRDRAVLGRDFEAPVWDDHGAMVGKIRAQVHGDEVLRQVLAHSRSGEGEIPFALDAQGNLHTVSARDKETLRKMPLVVAVKKPSARWAFGDWVFATTRDPESGVAFGIARRMPLAEVRQTAARNFGYGLGMIGLALLGILPLSGRVTRDLKLVTEGAGRIAQG
ncbi:MAG TPA: hypothetical protein VIJ61_12830, partial [Thermoanaerobaculia bacterium]